MPAQFRRDLAGGAVISIGSEGRLVIWPADAWIEYTQSLRVTTVTPAEQRRYSRVLHASSRPVELDAQGRILLTPDHRRYAGVDERAVFIGMGNCVEIVSAERWGSESSDLTPEFFTELQDRISSSGPPSVTPAQA